MDFTDELETALTELDNATADIEDWCDMYNAADIKNALDHVVAKARAVLTAANWA
jgi:hypothetical protein